MFGQMGLKTLVIRDTKAGEPYQNIQMFKKKTTPKQFSEILHARDLLNAR